MLQKANVLQPALYSVLAHGVQMRVVMELSRRTLDCRRSVPQLCKPCLNQPLNDGKNDRG